jgi:hypothetical protein
MMILKLKQLVVCAILFVLIPTIVAAQDLPPDDDTPQASAPQSFWTVRSEDDGDLVWHKEIASACLFTDHNYTLEIPADPQHLNDISYTMSNFDVDYSSNCSKGVGPEVDKMYFNNRYLGLLTGANQSWSLNSWPLEAGGPRSRIGYQHNLCQYRLDQYGLLVCGGGLG